MDAAPLLGKNLACVGRRGDEPEAIVLREAVHSLGAHLAWLPGLAAPVANAGAAAAASAAPGELPLHLLRRLYDLIVLPDAAPDQAQALEAAAGLPVVPWPGAGAGLEGDGLQARQRLIQQLLSRLAV